MVLLKDELLVVCSAGSKDGMELHWVAAGVALTGAQLVGEMDMQLAVY